MVYFGSWGRRAFFDQTVILWGCLDTIQILTFYMRCLLLRIPIITVLRSDPKGLPSESVKKSKPWACVWKSCLLLQYSFLRFP